MNISTLLKLLPVVGPVIAALPEFKALWDEASATFAPGVEQNTLKAAYEAAVDDAEGAHDRLQSIVAGHGS